MSLPQSVQAQADAAAKHFEREPENPEVDQPTAQGDAQNPPGDAPSPEPKPDGEAQSAKQPDDTTRQEPKAESQDALYWQHRFNVLQGKYNNELPALRQENETLRQQVADKDTRVKELEQQAPADSGTGVSDDQLAKFKQEFGEDLVTFVERMVSQQKPATPDDGKQSRELTERLERLEAENQEDAQARFWMGLEKAVPNYREINNDAKFHQFLASFDPQSGKQRQQMLVEAQQNLDAKGVADVFQLYLDQAGRTERPAVPEEQVEPRTTRATQAPQGKQQWTRSEINQFYRDKTAGRYGAEEAQRLEADIFAAQAEGRIR